MNEVELKVRQDLIDSELKSISDSTKVLMSRKRKLESEKARLQAIQQTACDHPREARDFVMVNNEPEYFCTLCGKDF
ncbi:hypothetical protein FDJ19_gp193 [Vibrio phage Ceto]|uniref:Uncharacterized protein n=1 Tax=Vibrio phage Ceto TaxID=2570300 RepID=A0A2H5BGI9_9CAUD|nr:hypothetical protein FDJ19_gp193 [Vibrio phage Ceto]AUG85105.1 hypothetical protein CETO_113 [Vibrio phage Ceto]